MPAVKWAITRHLLAWSAASTPTLTPATAPRIACELLPLLVVGWVFAMSIRLYSPECFSLTPICAFRLLSVRGRIPEVNEALSLSFRPGELDLQGPGN